MKSITLFLCERNLGLPESTHPHYLKAKAKLSELTDQILDSIHKLREKGHTVLIGGEDSFYAAREAGTRISTIGLDEVRNDSDFSDLISALDRFVCFDFVALASEPDLQSESPEDNTFSSIAEECDRRGRNAE